MIEYICDKCEKASTHMLGDIGGKYFSSGQTMQKVAFQIRNTATKDTMFYSKAVTVHLCEECVLEFLEGLVAWGTQKKEG